MNKKYFISVQETEEEKWSDIAKIFFDLEQRKIEIENKEKIIDVAGRETKQDIINFQIRILKELSFETLAELAIEIFLFQKETHKNFSDLLCDVINALNEKRHV